MGADPIGRPPDRSRRPPAATIPSPWTAAMAASAADLEAWL